MTRAGSEAINDLTVGVSHKEDAERHPARGRRIKQAPDLSANAAVGGDFLSAAIQMHKTSIYGKHIPEASIGQHARPRVFEAPSMLGVNGRAIQPAGWLDDDRRSSLRGGCAGLVQGRI